jgi:hypothetical protein
MTAGDVERTQMNLTLSCLISAGIAGFGVWIIAHTMASGSPSGWTFMGIPPLVVGLIRLYQAIGDARHA